MTCKMMHQIGYGFYWNVRAQNFFGLFCEFFCLCPPALYELYAPRFYQMKVARFTSICGKFHQYSICGCEVKNFQSFLHWFNIQWNGPFLVFWALAPPNIVQSCWNFDQRLSVSNKTNRVFEKSFKILNFNLNGRHPKFTVLFHFGAQFAAGKP